MKAHAYLSHFRLDLFPVPVKDEKCFLATQEGISTAKCYSPQKKSSSSLFECLLKGCDVFFSLLLLLSSRSVLEMLLRSLYLPLLMCAFFFFFSRADLARFCAPVKHLVTFWQASGAEEINCAHSSFECRN